MNKKDFEKLLLRYLDGNCSEEEEKWLNQYYASLDKVVGEDLREEEWPNLQNKIWGNIATLTQKNNQVAFEPDGERFRVKMYIFGIAASIALLLGCFTFLNRQITKKTQPAALSTTSEPTIRLVVLNTTGKTLHHDLQDGSIVWLEPGAELSYPQHFSENRRDLKLKGKAFFDVAHDPLRPFRVYGNEVVVKVLGTSFSVDFKPEEKDAEILVRSGKVSVFALTDEMLSTHEQEGIRVVEKKAKKIMLIANQKVVINTLKNKFEREDVVLEHWKKQVNVTNFVFNNTPLEQVVQQLEDAYKVSIKLENPQLNACSFTANLKDQSLDLKLEIICKTIGAKYKVDQEKYIITGEGCSTI